MVLMLVSHLRGIFARSSSPQLSLANNTFDSRGQSCQQSSSNFCNCSAPIAFRGHTAELTVRITKSAFVAARHLNMTWPRCTERDVWSCLRAQCRDGKCSPGHTVDQPMP